MSNSEAIRDLLSKFPALKPTAIERLLESRSVIVDTNLIRVARLRYRRSQEAKKQADRIICRILELLLDSRPEFLRVIKSSFIEVLTRLVEVAATHPSAPEDEIAAELANQLTSLPLDETPLARWARAFMLVLDKYPKYRRSMRIAQGWSDKAKCHLVVPILRDETLVLPDDEIEKDILLYLEANYPSGSTVEDIARAYFQAIKRQEARADEEQREVEKEKRDRAARVLDMVLEDLEHPAVDQDDALTAIQQIVAKFSDWPDEEIAEWVRNDIEYALGLEDDEENARHIEGLTIKRRI